MTIRHFRIFAAVASCESITKAAERLYVTQPTVSVAIREMEEHYGTRFFERIRQRLRITEEGRAMLSHVLHLLEQYDEMEKMFRNPDSQGLLRVGTSANVGSGYMAELTAVFLRRYPGMQIKVRVSSADSLEKLLMDNQLDLAVASGAFHSPSIRLKLLFSEPYMAVCAPGHELAGKTVFLREFMGYPLLFREERSGAYEVFQAAVAQAGGLVEPVWESSSQEALLEAARNGLGLTILPLRLAQEEEKKGRLACITIRDFAFRSPVYLACHQHKFISPGMKKFMDFAVERLQVEKETQGEEIPLSKEPLSV